jgi:hypothetical protein
MDFAAEDSDIMLRLEFESKYAVFSLSMTLLLEV